MRTSDASPWHGRVRHVVRRLIVGGLVLLLRGDQGLLRPFLIGSCKFSPTCSEYAIEALQRHGCRKGLALTVRRVCRCHPFGPGGIDPVP